MLWGLCRAGPGGWRLKTAPKSPLQADVCDSVAGGESLLPIGSLLGGGVNSVTWGQEIFAPVALPALLMKANSK